MSPAAATPSVQPLVIELGKPSPRPPAGAFAYLNSVPSKLAKIGGRRIQLARTHPDEEGEVIEVPELPGGLLQLPSTQQQMDSRLVELVDDPTFLLIGMYRALTAPTGPLSATFLEQKPLEFKKKWRRQLRLDGSMVPGTLQNGPWPERKIPGRNHHWYDPVL